jgi:hypothetical protein
MGMPQLFFKKIFLEAIRAGRKTTTLRRWAKCRIHPGDHVYSLALGWLKIGVVENIDFDSLGEADAKADGFESLAELKKAVEEIYPDHKSDGKRWYRLHFALASPLAMPAKGKRARKRGKPSVGKRILPPQCNRIDRAEKSQLAWFVRVELDKAVAASRLSATL